MFPVLTSKDIISYWINDVFAQTFRLNVELFSFIDILLREIASTCLQQYYIIQKAFGRSRKDERFGCCK